MLQLLHDRTWAALSLDQQSNSEITEITDDGKSTVANIPMGTWMCIDDSQTMRQWASYVSYSSGKHTVRFESGVTKVFAGWPFSCQRGLAHQQALLVAELIVEGVDRSIPSRPIHRFLRYISQSESSVKITGALTPVFSLPVGFFVADWADDWRKRTFRGSSYGPYEGGGIGKGEDVLWMNAGLIGMQFCVVTCAVCFAIHRLIKSMMPSTQDNINRRNNTYRTCFYDGSYKPVWRTHGRFPDWVNTKTGAMLIRRVDEASPSVEMCSWHFCSPELHECIEGTSWPLGRRQCWESTEALIVSGLGTVPAGDHQWSCVCHAVLGDTGRFGMAMLHALVLALSVTVATLSALVWAAADTAIVGVTGMVAFSCVVIMLLMLFFNRDFAERREPWIEWRREPRTISITPDPHKPAYYIAQRMGTGNVYDNFMPNLSWADLGWEDGLPKSKLAPRETPDGVAPAEPGAVFEVERTDNPLRASLVDREMQHELERGPESDWVGPTAAQVTLQRHAELRSSGLRRDTWLTEPVALLKPIAALFAASLWAWTTLYVPLSTLESDYPEDPVLQERYPGGRAGAGGLLAQVALAGLAAGRQHVFSLVKWYCYALPVLGAAGSFVAWILYDTFA